MFLGSMASFVFFSAAAPTRHIASCLHRLLLLALPIKPTSLLFNKLGPFVHLAWPRTAEIGDELYVPHVIRPAASSFVQDLKPQPLMTVYRADQHISIIGLPFGWMKSDDQVVHVTFAKGGVARAHQLLGCLRLRRSPMQRLATRLIRLGATAGARIF